MGWRSDAAKNVARWTQVNEEYTDARASDSWALDSIHWDIWALDESELNVLGDVDGLDVVELGCGRTASRSSGWSRCRLRPTRRRTGTTRT